MPTASIEQLQQMISDLILSQKETDAKFKETEKFLNQKFSETRELFKETEKILNQKFSDTDAKFKDTDRKIKEANALFTSQWGKLIESLVKGDLVNLLRQRGIDVHDTSERRKGNHEGENYEFDIIAHNGSEIVIVEVKTTLRTQDVKLFLSKLAKVKLWLAEYKHFKIYGAVAYLKAEEASDIMAMNKGLFSIRATGNSATITNASEFVPFVF
ncbi:MAG TPA: hypothetical protein PK006_13275 [Saprospiraceae bacterium]|nr:hypothetical protein [Saprospiraceae bacterium]